MKFQTVPQFTQSLHHLTDRTKSENKGSAKIKKVAYRAPAAQLKTYERNHTALYHSLAVQMFNFRSHFFEMLRTVASPESSDITTAVSCTREGSVEHEKKGWFLMYVTIPRYHVFT